MDLVVYGRSTPPCSFCEDIKTLLDSKGVGYEYKDISDDKVFEEFMKFRLRTVPAVFNNDKYLGGFTETNNLLKGF